MSGWSMRYVDRARLLPERPVAGRLRDHREIYPPFDAAGASAQAARCEQCGTPYCQVFCPLHNNIPDWLALTAQGRFREAYELARATNNMPEICGRICPQDRLCEAKWACTLEQSGHGAVTIGHVERWLGDLAAAEGWEQPRRPSRERGERVAVVGAGPAGMTVAEELRVRGFGVTLFDRLPRMGGLMAYGIPGFKLAKEVVARRERLLREAGVAFVPGAKLGRDLDLARLRRDFDAVVLATGAWRSRRLKIVGEDLPGVVPALDWLADACRPLWGEPSRTEWHVHDRRVVVVGGGDTAMDCIRTALRQGAKAVTCLYRRDEAQRPGSPREFRHAEREGGRFLWRVAPGAVELVDAATAPPSVPVELLAAEPLAVDSRRQLRVRALATRPVRGFDGELRYEPDMASPTVVSADFVILATGLTVEPSERWSSGLLEADARGRLPVDPRTRMTRLAGVFAAGDVTRGPSLAVWAIREGRETAAAVAAWLDDRACARRMSTVEQGETTWTGS